MSFQGSNCWQRGSLFATLLSNLPKGQIMEILSRLQQSLQRELPGCIWHCHAGTDAQTLTASGVPSEIEITAVLSGRPVDGSPFHVSGDTLNRWGADATARFICAGLPVVSGRMYPRPQRDWDRLAEL